MFGKKEKFFVLTLKLTGGCLKVICPIYRWYDTEQAELLLTTYAPMYDHSLQFKAEQ